MSSRKRASSHFELKMAPRRTKRLAVGTILFMQKKTLLCCAVRSNNRRAHSKVQGGSTRAVLYIQAQAASYSLSPDLEPDVVLHPRSSTADFTTTSNPGTLPVPPPASPSVPVVSARLTRTSVNSTSLNSDNSTNLGLQRRLGTSKPTHGGPAGPPGPPGPTGPPAPRAPRGTDERQAHSEVVNPCALCARAWSKST